MELGLTGVVKNQPDGSVFIRASGPSQALNHLIACSAGGASPRRVISVQVETIEPRALLVLPFNVDEVCLTIKLLISSQFRIADS